MKQLIEVTEACHKSEVENVIFLGNDEQHPATVQV